MLESLGPFALFLTFIAAIIFSLLWLALIHKVRGKGYRKEVSTRKSLSFKTDIGAFRLDKGRGSFIYKPRGEHHWRVAKLEFLEGIYYRTSVKSAGLFEFLLSDWSIWDFHGKYRDQTNICTVELEVSGGDNIVLAEIKQYQQRELWLGQVVHDLQIKLLRSANLNYAVEDVTSQWIATIVAKFAKYEVELSVLEPT